VLGQCDTFWAGCCVLAVAAAVTDRPYRMAVWAGVGFAFKAQAAFLAPFCIAILLRRRAWPAVAIPPLIYLAAITPAVLAGWPIGDLLTIYLRQPQFTFIGDAPNLWAFPHAFHVSGPSIFLFSYILGAAAALVGIGISLRAKDLPNAALLSSMLPVFFLAKMTSRFFFLDDVLSLAIAFVRRDRRSIAIAALIQLGSFLSIIAYLHDWPWLNAAASIFTAAGLATLLVQTFAAGRVQLDRERVSADGMLAPQER
jgi:Gpi18-like mannosyltransferase